MKLGLFETSLSGAVEKSQQTRFGGAEKNKIIVRKKKKYKINDDSYGEVFDFFLNIPLEVLDNESLSDVADILDEIELAGKVINESFTLSDEILLDAKLFTKSSSLQNLKVATKWYKMNKQKVKQRKKGVAFKRLERKDKLLKQMDHRKTATNRDRKKYPKPDTHTNEKYIRESIELKKILLEK